MSNLRIDIASEFIGRKAFTDAEKATNSLDKAVDKLGKRLAGAFSAYKIAQFAKDSVKAFAQDQKAAAVLAKTLENVNQGYATDMVESYIKKTETLYGVLDDKLRPAFSQLVVATGDATKSQALLQTALDVSAGTGKDLESVTAALSKAYLGNTTALARLGAGLSSATLKGKSFDQIITLLNQNFTGQAATAADSYQGKIDRLNVAFENMKETIGQGIIDSFSQLNSDQGFNGVIDKMGKLATYISDVTVGLGVIASKIQNALPSVSGANAGALKVLISPLSPILDALAGVGAKKKVSQSQPSVVTNFLSDMNKIAAATAKANTQGKQLLTTAKGLTKEAKDKLALDKASLELKRAESIFDLDKIELAAASLNKQTAEDYARIKLKQDLLALQDAIAAGNAEEATKLSAIVEEDYKRVWAFQAQNIALGIQNGTIANIQAAAKLIPTDLKLVNLDNLKSALDYINQMLAALSKVPSAGSSTTTTTTTTSTGGGGTSVTTVYPPSNPNLYQGSGVYDYKSPYSYGFGNPNLQSSSGVFNSPNMYSFGNANPNLYSATGGYGQQSVTVTVVDNTSGLIDVITDATQQASANGINTRLVRNTGGLSW